MKVIKAKGFRSMTLKDSYPAKILVGIDENDVVIIKQRLLLPELSENDKKVFTLLRKFKDWYYVENTFFVRKESLYKIFLIVTELNLNK